MKNTLEPWEAGLRDRVKSHEFPFDPAAHANFEALLATDHTVAGRRTADPASPGRASRWPLLLLLLTLITGAWWYATAEPAVTEDVPAATEPTASDEERSAPIATLLPEETGVAPAPAAPVPYPEPAPAPVPATTPESAPQPALSPSTPKTALPPPAPETSPATEPVRQAPPRPVPTDGTPVRPRNLTVDRLPWPTAWLVVVPTETALPTPAPLR